VNFYVPDGADARLFVRLTPRAKRDEIAGVIEVEGRPALAVRLTAPPVEGAANKALIAFLAERLGVPKSAVTIETGDKSRLKIVRVRGVTDRALLQLVPDSG
jgi:uncharacterized protein (TIGR00251 family)